MGQWEGLHPVALVPPEERVAVPIFSGSGSFMFTFEINKHQLGLVATYAPYSSGGGGGGLPRHSSALRLPATRGASFE